MSIQWYYKVGEKEAGPLSELQVRAMLFSSDFRSDAAVRQGNSQWFTAESVRRMFSELEAVGWYVFFEDREHGPYIRPKLEEIVSQNHFGPSALVREGVMGNWELLSKRFGDKGDTSSQNIVAGPTLINSSLANDPPAAKIESFTIPHSESQALHTKLNEQPHRSVTQEPIVRAPIVHGPPPLLVTPGSKPATNSAVLTPASSAHSTPKVAITTVDHVPVAPPVVAPSASTASTTNAPVSSRREPPSIKLAIGIMAAVAVVFLVIYTGSLLLRSTPQTAPTGLGTAAQTNQFGVQTSPISSIDHSANKIESVTDTKHIVVERPASAPPLGDTSPPFQTGAGRKRAARRRPVDKCRSERRAAAQGNRFFSRWGC